MLRFAVVGSLQLSAEHAHCEHIKPSGVEIENKRIEKRAKIFLKNGDESDPGKEAASAKPSRIPALNKGAQHADEKYAV